jgi:hypothetical protein
MNTEFYNSIIKHLTTWQYQLNSYISTHIRAIDDDSSVMMSLMPQHGLPGSQLKHCGKPLNAMLNQAVSKYSILT